MLFANLDAKTVSQPGGILERNQLLGEMGPGQGVNETKMSENEAFLAYCQQDNDDDD